MDGGDCNEILVKFLKVFDSQFAFKFHCALRIAVDWPFVSYHQQYNTSNIERTRDAPYASDGIASGPIRKMVFSSQRCNIRNKG